MASLIGKALRNAGGPPVPLSSQAMATLPGTGMAANLDLALIRAYKQNGTALSNISMLAWAVAAPTWHLYRQQPQDGRRRYTTHDQGSDQRKEVIQHAALNVLSTPACIRVNGVRWQAWTRPRLMEISGIWMETAGKSHWVVDHPEGSTLPLSMWPVRPDRMVPVPDRDNYMAGWIYTSPDGTERVPLLPTEVIYNNYPDPEDPYGGYGPLGSVLVDVEAARYSAEWNRNYFENSAEPGGVIQVDHELQDDEFNDLVNRWREAHRGVARSHRVAVLEGGQTWVPNVRSMKDMDFANLRGTSRDIIREALGMHKVMTGVTEDVNRANAQTGEEVFASWKVAPRLDRWRDNVFNSQMLPLFGTAGDGVEFDYSYPTPQNREQDNAELTAKVEAFASLVGAGADPGDAAEVVGLPAMKMAERATQSPALPPAWVPAGAAPAPESSGKAEVVDRALAAMLRERAGWDSPAWRELAAFNRAGAGR